MNLRDIILGGIDWFNLVQWRALVHTVMKLRVPSNVEKFLSGCTTGGFSRRVQLHAVS
jgi:hypothetical protein